ncbi:unnamed protein product [Adineta steineri]|uniref:Kinesin light chain n=1 Tax=Adineta steineri TaxID=433720 RepID=A0A819ZFP0_9BILA|nr:unnamed protein product [Adineta steineri]
MDVDIIVRMGFFIKDLHQDIQRLNSEQFNDDQSSKAFIVYRGQDLSKEDLTKMTNNKGGLLSFNNFLSTSENRDVSFNFIQQTATNADHVRILFVISINPSSSTTPFASITDISYFHTKDEVLFSMHTIFRIGDIKSINGNNDLYEVNLTLTNENDQDLLTLTDYIRQETFPDKEGWFRLGSLLIKMGQFNKAQEVYEVLLHQTTDESEKASIYHQLGIIKDDQGEYQEALPYFEKSLAIFQKTHPSNHHRLGTSYNNIGMVYDSMGDYPKALSYYEKALEIQRESLPPNHPDLTASYNNIGIVYHSMGEYPKAFLSHEKALAMKRQSLSSNRFDWSMTYNNLGNLHNSMGNYPVALSFYEKALAIRQQSLPPNHPSLGTSYNNIGLVYYNMGDYPKALSNYEKDLTILQESVPSYHPDLGDTCNKIGTVYEKMSDYSKAHSFYERAVQIGQQSLPINHPNLEIYRRNLEDIKKKL